MGDYMKYPVKKMNPQAIKLEEILPARCSVTGEDFDIALGYDKGQLTMINGKLSLAGPRGIAAVTPAPSIGKELRTLDLKAGLYASRTYHCPVCGNKDIVRCGICLRITCYDGSGSFKCAYCGNSGKVSGTMDRVQVYDRSKPKSEPKKSGLKPGKESPKYYPGDKGDKYPSMF